MEAGTEIMEDFIANGLKPGNKAHNETVIVSQRKNFFRNPLEIELKTYYISRNLKTNV